MADVAAKEDVDRDARNAELIHSIFEFGDTVVREVMVPRPDMVAVEADATIEAAIERAIEGGYSRLPAYEDTTDDIVGLVYLKDLVHRARAGGGDEPVRAVVRPARVRPRAEAGRRAAARDADASSSTWRSSSTSTEAPPGSSPSRTSSRRSSARSPTSTTSKSPASSISPTARCASPAAPRSTTSASELGVELPDTEWDTVGGLVFNLLGHVPDEGEAVRFQNLEFRTERVQGRRIVSVRITSPRSRPTESRGRARSPTTPRPA